MNAECAFVVEPVRGATGREEDSDSVPSDQGTRMVHLETLSAVEFDREDLERLLLAKPIQNDHEVLGCHDASPRLIGSRPLYREHSASASRPCGAGGSPLSRCTAMREPFNLIRAFDFYLALMFLISLVRRYDVYWNAVRILFAVRGRWPRLVQRLAEHRSLLLNGAFFRPIALALALTIVQMVCSRLIWPGAVLLGSDLHDEWWKLAVIVVPLAAMLAIDLYFIIRVGRFDREGTVKDLDRAESWLGKKGSLVRIVTFGYVDPHKQVDDELKKNLEYLGSSVKSSMLWVSGQIAARVLFGLALWTVWFLTA
jgi:hypothetical protein